MFNVSADWNVGDKDPQVCSLQFHDGWVERLTGITMNSSVL